MANANFTCTLHAWAEGNSIKAYMTYARTDGNTYFYQDTYLPTPTMTIAGTSYSDTAFADVAHNGVNIGSASTTTFTKSGLANGTYTVTWNCGSGGRSDFAGTWSTQVTVSVVSPPTGITVALVSRTWNTIRVSASITGWGSGGTSSGRMLQVMAGNTSMPISGAFANWPRRMVNLGAVTSGTRDITSSSTQQGSSAWYIKGCTAFKVASYATNGVSDARARNTTIYYTPPAPLQSLSLTGKIMTGAGGKWQVTVLAAGGSSAVNNNVTVATQYRYSINGGSTWSSWAQIGGAGTPWSIVSGSINNLPGDTVVTVQARQVYQNLASEVKTATYTTGPLAKTYLPVNGQARFVKKMYVSVNGQARALSKLYAGGSDGKAKLIFSSKNGY